MGTFSITVVLELPSYTLSREAFPALAAAVQQVTDSVQSEWASYASGAPMPNGKVIANRTGEYLRSILTRQTGDFSGEVYSDLRYASEIEEGSPARDMKKILDSSYKVRTSKKGGRYLIIPFRINAPNSALGNTMPEEVFKWWQGRATSSITGTYRRVSGTGAYDIATRQLATVPGWRYKWGDRLGKGDLAGMGITGKQAERLTGMYHFRETSPNAGGARHGQYINFRVMSSASKPGSWIAPAREGMWPARTAGEHHQAIAEQLFKAAAEQDIQRLLGSEKTNK